MKTPKRNAAVQKKKGCESMIGWLIAMCVCGGVMVGVYIGKYGSDAAIKAIAIGADSLLTGFVFLEMTAAEMIASNYEWRNTLEDNEFVYCLLRFGGWALIAWGVSQFVMAVVLKVDEMGCECANRLEKK